MSSSAEKVEITRKKVSVVGSFFVLWEKKRFKVSSPFRGSERELRRKKKLGKVYVFVFLYYDFLMRIFGGERSCEKDEFNKYLEPLYVLCRLF